MMSLPNNSKNNLELHDLFKSKYLRKSYHSTQSQNIFLKLQISFMIHIVESPIMIKMRRSPFPSKIFSRISRIVNIRNKSATNFIPISQQHMYTIIMPDKLIEPSRIGVDCVFGQFVNPMVYIIGEVLRGLSSPWMLKMSQLRPKARGQML